MRNLKFVFVPVIQILFCGFYLKGQIPFDSLLNTSKVLKAVASDPKKYHLQILYTQVSMEGSERTFSTFTYFPDPHAYLYCASLVKLPVAVLVLQKLNELGIPPDYYLFSDSSESCQRSVRRDTSSASGYPSAEHYIKKMLLVSDNDAYNRCFEFLGTDYIHNKLISEGYDSLRITNRYDLYCSAGKSRFTNPVRVCSKDLKVVYSQEPLPIDPRWKQSLWPVKVGNAYKDENNKLVMRPRDFSGMNYFSLKDAHRFLTDLVFNAQEKFGLSMAQQQFLLRQMGLYPRQSQSPRYNSRDFPDNYKKYLYFGDFKEPINDTNFVSTNCVGQSYGFLTDCMHFKDKKNGLEFLLSAGLYVNENGIINDGKYEYNSLGLPFLAELGRAVHAFELKRKQNH